MDDIIFEKPRINTKLFETLHNHKHIAWDLDETLIDNRRSSKYLRGFILNNPQICHHLITFRTHGYEQMVWHDLGLEGPNVLSEKHFSNLFHPSDRMYEDYQSVCLARSTGLLKGPLTRPELAYMEWKGKVCFENNMTILIDDRTETVILGCQKHNIMHHHPDEFVG